MDNKGLSFNATFGPILAILVILFMYLGLNYGYDLAFIIAGYLSIIAGVVMLIWTLSSNAYIGTILAPVMWLCMILLVVIGIALVYSPLNLIMKSYFFDFERIAFYSYIVILGLAILHIVTGK